MSAENQNPFPTRKVKFRGLAHIGVAAAVDVEGDQVVIIAPNVETLNRFLTRHFPTITFEKRGIYHLAFVRIVQ